MSFQGDVGGIGLAELLQSLARGRREGTLTLIGKGSLSSTLGLQGGRLLFLPEPEEDPEIWRRRSRRAWADDTEAAIDQLHMSEIARARRIEVLYQLLDSEGVHFRFNPGPLPEGADGSASENTAPGDQVHCPGSPVEFLLLEYARLQDEAAGLGSDTLEDDVVPRALDPGSAAHELARFFGECDGTSDLSEIADRLGWPLRQCRNAVAEQLRSGTLRIAQPRELLALVQKELSRAHYERATARLAAWCRTASPGPLPEGDADMLNTEWKAGRLQRLLPGMTAQAGRRLLRRMEVGRFTAAECISHWQELAKHHRNDRIIVLRIVILQIRDEGNPESPSMRDLLRVSRWMREAGTFRRAGALLRVAAQRMPNTTGSRLEVGMGMLSAGLVEEGTPWVLEAVQTLVEEGAHERAVAPLRAILEVDPRNREARRLLGRTRGQVVQRRIVRKNTLVGMAVLLALGAGAWVQIRHEQDFDRKLNDISARLEDPEDAQRLLELYFGDSTSRRVEDLRKSIGERRIERDASLRTAWNDLYREAQLECTLGDPALGLRRTLDLPTPPQLATSNDPWPLVSDLFNGLAARLEEIVASLEPPETDSRTTINAEQELATRIVGLQKIVTDEPTNPELEDFAVRLAAVVETLEERDEARAAARAERARQENLIEQDHLLAAARAHRVAGDLDRALANYQKLLEKDDTGQLAQLVVLREEIEATRNAFDALLSARRMAAEGRHEEARELMQEGLENPGQYLLPWRVESFPSGGRARLRDGSEHVTPFVMHSTLGQKVWMQLELDGHEPVELTIDEPSNQFIYFSLEPERSWEGDRVIAAPPVAVSPDHIVCDRAGSLRRLGRGGRVLWERELSSLGGIARTPVFLPKKPGHLLVLTEEGDAWIIDASSGSTEGPWSTGSPPAVGPIVTQEGVVARLSDGRVVTWTNRLRPYRVHAAGEIGAPAFDGAPTQALFGSDAGLEILHRAASSDVRLASPWSELAVEAAEDIFRVLDSQSGEALFAVRRTGEWQYMAWEAPYAGVPRGRLWISDGEGLRAFTP